ncbi:MAG: flavin reductase family protein [Chlorobiaceae bacterium]|nr:flavin reductase family protein [Chlorobiaceae bacterium]
MKHSIGAKTLLFPTPVLLIGTYDEAGRPNLMNAAWGGICSSEPPCVAVSVRRARHTYDAIVRRGAFTIGVASESHVAEADYVGIVSGRNTDKFAFTGLTPARSDVVDAPYAEEFPVVLECRLLKTVEIGVHVQFIGQIVDVKADSAVLSEDGLPDILKIKPFVYDPSHRGYYGIGAFAGQAFAIGKSISS